MSGIERRQGKNASKICSLTRGGSSSGSSRSSTSLTSGCVDGDGSGSSGEVGESVGDGGVGDTERRTKKDKVRDRSSDFSLLDEPS